MFDPGQFALYWITENRAKPPATAVASGVRGLLRRAGELLSQRANGAALDADGGDDQRTPSYAQFCRGNARRAQNNPLGRARALSLLMRAAAIRCCAFTSHQPSQYVACGLSNGCAADAERSYIIGPLHAAVPEWKTRSCSYPVRTS